MNTPALHLSQLSNQALIAEVKRLAEGERQATAQLIASLMELDTRRLYLSEGCSSLFTYCTQVLHLSEHAAGMARATKRDSRHIPAAVRRAVWTRDGGQCAFVGTGGRCTETGFLEFHHVVPYAIGGRANIENIELRCAAHNAHEAEQSFGERRPPLVRERRWSYGPM